MSGKNNQNLKNVQVSTETYELLSRIKEALEKIFKKKNISYDKVIHFLAVAKVDYTEIIEILEGE